MKPFADIEAAPLLNSDKTIDEQSSTSELVAPTSPVSPPFLSTASRSKLQGRRYLGGTGTSSEARVRDADVSSSGVHAHALSASTEQDNVGFQSYRPMSAKAMGKRPARSASASGHVVDIIHDDGDGDAADNDGTYGIAPNAEGATGSSKAPKPRRGRNVTVIFANLADLGSTGPGGEATSGNLELWVEDGESVGSVKDQVSIHL